MLKLPNVLLNSTFEMPQEKFLVSKPAELHVPEIKGIVIHANDVFNM